MKLCFSVLTFPFSSHSYTEYLNGLNCRSSLIPDKFDASAKAIVCQACYRSIIHALTLITIAFKFVLMALLLFFHDFCTLNIENVAIR